MNNSIEEIKQALSDLAIKEKAEILSKFFKTGKGQYGEGDQFIGVPVPEQKKVAKAFWKLVSLKELGELLRSPIHEHRLTALFILIFKFEKNKTEQKAIVEFYLQHLDFVNNWDLVDTSCYKLLGRYCFENQCPQLMLDLAKSPTMWHKRIAIVGTLYFIKKKDFVLAKTLITQELNHSHDLMHKANGWMLREMGKIDETELLTFLRQHYRTMPRTTLRYAIEKLDENQRQDFLKGRV